MSITRTKLSFERDFTQIPNAWLRDKRLSRKARGLLAELMSHSEGWVVTLESLVASGPEGTDSIRSGIKELMDAGYLIRTRIRKEDGTLAGADYALNDPNWENPTQVDPVEVESHTKKTISKEDHSKEQSPALPGLDLDQAKPVGKIDPMSGFDLFWDLWPRKESRKAAMAAWPKAVKAAGSVEVILTGARRKANLIKAERTEMKHIPLPTTWLNGERWNDFLPASQIPVPSTRSIDYRSEPHPASLLTEEETQEALRRWPNSFGEVFPQHARQILSERELRAQRNALGVK